MNKLIAIASLLFLCSSILIRESKEIKVFNDKKKSKISYAMRHPLHSWTAKSKDVTSIIMCDEQKQNITQVAVSAPVSSFDSQNANRDSHAIEVTEALTYPTITFESSTVTQLGDSLPVEGTLTFHGVKQPISFKAARQKINQQLEVTGGFRVTMTEFNVEPPSLMGISTEDHIDIRFDIFY